MRSHDHFTFNLFENDAVGIVQTNCSGTILAANHKFSQRLNLDNNALIGCKFQMLIPESERMPLSFLHEDLLHRIKNRDFRIHLHKLKNKPILVHLHFSLEHDETTQARYYIIVVQFMSEISSFAKEIIDHKKVLHQLIQHVDAYQAMIDTKGNFTSVMPLFADAYGHNVHKIEGKHISEVIPAPAYHEMLPYIGRCFNGERCTWENEYTLSDESVHYGLSALAPIFNEHNEVVQALVTNYDLTEQVLAQSALQTTHVYLQQLASIDPMTQVYNAQYFETISEKSIALAVRNQDPLSLLRVDIDDFYLINTSLGTTLADHMIVVLAEQLTLLTRKADVVARLGGKEFAILLPRTDRKGAITIAEKICQTIAEFQPEIDGIPLQFTVSIGVASLDAQQASPLKEMMEYARRAVNSAKSNGKNCVV
ncbi:MAG: diguanylate cyclase [Zetaproteobacteria bacterium]|nr:diguanylate cyclase [Zetaproteobacteria bacterium]